ncbi:zinc-ribbon domain-containing protein [Butyrivibrio fibrisolvens]|uniref:Zinc-ribbon domain-containing protein n=1 Tax=Butyrivibrio fibrisolvens TaxID=831 RepID=A0A1H9WRB1_BUTFI|nr:zinc-ribbon domain-containing protein [Butyrivibrio fibrisolvens]SES36207.1 zinc-ribbon domain-containing protein [Butyrivibrio fibrisolvens]
MKKKNAQNPQQFQAAPPKRGMRLSTIIDVFMFITGILLTAMFFLPVYKDTVSYNKDFFKLDNLLGFFPDNAASYFGLAGKFLDDRNVAVTVMIFAFMFVMPILLAVLTFPKLRKLSGLAIIPIIVLVSGQFFFGAGFVIEQKALELAPIGFCYSVLIFQLPALYTIFIIQSIIEAGRLKKELKNAPNMGASAPAFGQPMGGQQFGPQGGFQPMNDQQFGPQGGFQPMNDQQFGPQGGFGQPVNDQQFAPQGGFAQPANDQQFGPQNGFAQPAADQQYGMPQEQFQQAPAFEQPQNNFYSEAPVNEIPAPSYEENANEAPSFDNAAEAAQNATENFEEVNETAGAASEAVDNGSDNAFDNSFENEADNSFGNVSDDSSESVSGNTTEFESQAPVAETSNTAPSYAEPAPEATPEQTSFTAPVQEAQEPVKMQPAFCQHCGAKLEQGALFCMQCGAPIKA